MEPEPQLTTANIAARNPYVWLPEDVEGIIGMSGFMWVGLLRDDHSTVLKYPHDINMPEALNAVHEELCRFAKLKPHPNLIVCKGFHRYGVLYEYCSGGNVEELLWEYPQRSDWQMARIAIQIADCLVHLHQQHFIHCDLTLQNNFLTAVGFVKVGDIQGQFNFPDGTPEIHALSSEHCTYRHPAASENEQSERADLFAFGMCLHYLWHGRAAFREFDELSTLGRFDEIRARYRNHDFPPLKCSAGIAQIMEKC